MGFWRDLFGSPQGHDTASGAKPTNADALSAFSNDEVQSAALGIIWDAGDRVETDASFWGGTVQRCDETLARLDQLREKYAAYQPPRMRKHIMAWFDYYERKARDNRRDCETQKHRRDHEAYCKKSNAKSARVRDLHAALKQSN